MDFSSEKTSLKVHNECTYNDKYGESLILYPVAHDDDENCCESEVRLIII